MSRNNPGSRWKWSVNGKRFTSADQVVQARDVLQKGKFLPPSEHRLIGLSRPGAILFGLDGDIDLANDPNEFRAFKSDRAYYFTGDEVEYAWGAPKITEPELRDVMGVDDASVLYLDRDDGDVPLTPTSLVDLTGDGVEDIRTGKLLITIYYADNPFEVERGTYTGADLMALFAVPASYILDRVKNGGGFVEVKPEQRVKVRDGMHFLSHPPKGQSS